MTSLKWDTMSTSRTITIYLVQPISNAMLVVKLREERTKKFITRYMENDTSTTFKNLKENTNYEIKVFEEDDDGSHKELARALVSTKQSVVDELMRMSKSSQEDTMTIYTLQPSVTRKIALNVREIHLLSECAESKDSEKTIMILGESGSGKTTLVDAMFNYLVGVTKYDDYRFRIVNLTEEEERKGQTKALSQTSTVTVYKIPKKEGFLTDFALNIIDTPGFGDTEGMEKDEKIPELIQALFTKSVRNLNAVCLVTKLSCNRLRDLEMSVFQSIMGLFGKDIENNIYACMTHDDGGQPQALEAMEYAKVKLNTTIHFRFNNSTLFSAEETVDVWNKRNETFKSFFNEVAQTKTQSLNSTTNVLKSRKLLKAQLENVRVNLKCQIEQITKIKNRQATLLKFKQQIEKNEHFEYEDIAIETVKTSCEKTNLNCTKCKKSCHVDCSPWGMNYICVVIDVYGSCKICTCASADHVNESFTYQNESKKVKKTKEDMLRAYQIATSNASTHEGMLAKEKKELNSALSSLDEIFQNIKKYLNDLGTHALSQSTSTLYDYIGNIVKEEQKRSPDDDLNRAQMSVLKKIADAVKREQKAAQLFDELLEMDFIPLN